MAKNYILNVKDIDGNWVGIPTLIGQQGVGITNITQQNKKLIIDLSDNTRKEFTIPSADLPNDVDILNKIINDSNVPLTEINSSKTKFNIGSSNESNSSSLRIRFTNNSSTFLGDMIDYYFNIDFGKETQSNFNFKHPSQDVWHNVYCNTLNAKDRVIAQGEIISSGDITAFSDIRLKTNIEKIENALDKVCQLSGYTYDMNNKRSTGVIAQEVEKVLPEVVQDREDGYKTVAYGNMIGLLIEAIKELKEEIKVIKNGN